MRDEQDGGVVIATTPVDQRRDEVLVGEVEAEQRLVAQQDVGIADQRLRDSQTLLLAARQGADGSLGVCLGSYLGECRVHRGFPLLPETDPGAPAVTVDAETDQVASAQGDALVEGLLLRHVARDANYRPAPVIPRWSRYRR